VNALTRGRSPASHTFKTRPAGTIDLEVVHTLGEAEESWRRLEADGAHSPFQTFDWHRLEARSMTRDKRPAIIVARDRTGTPLWLLPLALERQRPFRALTWLAGNQASYGAGLFRRDAAGLFAPGDLETLAARISRLVPEAHALILLNQRADDGHNLLALLPRVDGAGTGYAITLCPWDELYAARGNRRTRHNDRRREKRLGEIAPWRVRFAATPDECRRCMEILFAQKSVWLRERGIPDFLADPATRSFLTALATVPPRSAFRSEVAVLEVGAETAAVSFGLTHGLHHYLLVTSVHPGTDFRPFSPGDILFRQVLRSLCARGLESVDLGVGTTPQKEFYADRTFRVFHTLVPLTQAGRIHVAALRARLAAKRWIKDDPVLWELYRRCRRLRGFQAPAGDTSDR